MIRHIDVSCGKNIVSNVLITEDENGKIIIVIDAEKSELKNIEIRCLDAGIPGVMGPHVSFGVGDVVGDICDGQLEMATAYPWS